MFLLVPAYPGCPGSKAVKQLLLLLLFVFVTEDISREFSAALHGMRINMNKTKIMINGECQMVRQKDVRWP